MSAIYKPMVFEPGAVFARRFQCVQTKVAGKPLADLTGYTCQTQIRDKPGGTLIAQLPSTVDTTNSTFGFSLSADVTKTITFSTAVLDCLLIPSDPTKRVRTITSVLTYSPAVTVYT